MKTFHFYILVIAAVGAALIALASRMAKRLWLIEAGLCLTVAFLSLMFYLLDRRNRELVRNGEKALRCLDQMEQLSRSGAIPHDLEILAADDHQTTKKPRIPSPSAHYSFSWVIGMIYFWFGILSTAAGILCLLNIVE
jgi:Flp pilus assembly protein TadB